MRKAIGMGIISAAMHPSNVAAHCTPMFSNIWVAKRGKAAPTVERTIMLAAKADAALHQLALASVG